METNTLIALASATIAAYLASLFLRDLWSNRVNAYSFAILGYGVFSFLDIAKHYYSGYTSTYIRDSLALNVIALILFSFVVFILSYKGTSKATNSRLYRISSSLKNRKIWKAGWLILFMLGLTMFVYWLNPELHENSYFGIIAYLIKASILFFFYLYLKTRRSIYMLFVLIGCAIGLGDSSRRAYIVVMLPALIIYLQYNFAKYRKIGKALRLKVVLSLIIIFIFLNMLRADHDFGEGYQKGDPIANTVDYIVTLRSIDTFYNTSFIIDNFPKRFDYYYGWTYLSVPVALVPRSIWPNKPVGLASLLGLMQKVGTQEFSEKKWHAINRFSLSPGFVGEAYANFGIIGVLVVSWFLGFAAKKVDTYVLEFRKRDSIMLIPLIPALVGFMLVARGDFYSAVLYPVFISLFLLLIVKFNSHSKTINA